MENKLKTDIKAENQAAVSVSAGLSGKAKIDFEVWIWKYANEKEIQNISKNSFIEWIYDCDQIIRNAYIIEWFNSVGLLIGIYPNLYGNFVWHLNKSETYKRWSNDLYYESRIEATEKCIEKVNELYNRNLS